MPWHDATLKLLLHLAMLCLALCVISASAQTTGNSSLSGVVADPTGAVVPGATVEIHNPVSQFDRSTTTDSAGKFSFPEHSLQSLPPQCHRNRVRSLLPRYRCSFGCTAEPQNHRPDSGDRRKRYGPGRSIRSCWRTIPRFTPTWTAVCSTSFRWRVPPPS